MQKSKKVFGFQKQLAFGDKGEDFFVKCYKKRGAKKVAIREYDMIIDGDKSVELKSDSYPMSKTENFFFERYRNKETKKAGGPWQSNEHGCEYFVYCYIQDKTFFWFKTSDLCKFLNKIIKKYPAKQIRNKGWSCIGYCIPREIVRHLVIQEDKF